MGQDISIDHKTSQLTVVRQSFVLCMCYYKTNKEKKHTENPTVKR